MHHPGNYLGVAGASTTFISALNQWSPVLTWTVGLVTLTWYGYMFWKELKKKD